MNVLDVDSDRWLLHMLRAFNAGNWQEYGKTKQLAFKTYSDLAKHEALLVEKIQLMAVMELAFERSSASRALSFDEVAKRCQIKEDEVEMVLMRCMARELIKVSGSSTAH